MTTISNETDNLPDITKIQITHMPNGWWKITAPEHHIGCYLIGQDLGALMHEAPYVINHLLKLDGPMPIDWGKSWKSP